MTFQATLSEAWDPLFFGFPVAGTGSAAVGTLHLVYDTDADMAIDIDLEVQGLTTAEFLASHVHPPSDVPQVISLEGLTVVAIPSGFSIVDGMAPLQFPIYENDLLNDQAWINVHTVAFPPGEIAGRLFRVPPVSVFPWAGSMVVALLLLMALGTRMSGQLGKG